MNGSERGDRLTDLVGPGGMPSIVASARTVFFVGGWMAKAKWKIGHDGLKVVRAGPPKFVDRVRSVTVSAKAALEAGKRVFFVTNVGVFRLVPEGLLLCEVMPGIDVRQDILETSKARIVLPPDGQVPPVDQSIVTGRGFALRWAQQEPEV